MGRSVGCRVDRDAAEREEPGRSAWCVVDASLPFGGTLLTRGGDRLHRDCLSGDDDGVLIIVTGIVGGVASSGYFLRVIQSSV